MESAAAGPPSPPPSSSDLRLSPWSALVLAGVFGLVGGYLDLGMLALRKDVLHLKLYYEQGRYFTSVVPVGYLAVSMIAGLALAAVARVRPGLVSLRAGVALLTTLAVWGPLLRAPLFGWASLLLAAGLGRMLSRGMAARGRGLLRIAPYTLAALLGLVGVTALVTYRGQTDRESRALASLPPPPSVRGRNVLLIVMDTVRAESLSLYGYSRPTTPHLSRWARRGVRFEWALAPAPWTFPSHSSFLTGQWPSKLGAHWRPVLDPAYPTLAEYLSARGYLTAGFIANTYWCSYESHMDRGFIHYQDYPLTPRSILGSTMPGRWLVKTFANPEGYYGEKWIRSQSPDARGINRGFLDWLTRQRAGSRPFFAFLNYLDAHDPFVPPQGREGSPFGLRPRSARDYRMLLDYWDRDKLKISARDVALAHDSYDECIAALDREVGALLDELDRRGVLRETHVVIASDHGEEFGEHGVFNHGFSLYAPEVHVPLLIVSPDGPQDRAIDTPVSLRDLPATVVDLLGLETGSPFPGHSLADLWRPTAGSAQRSMSPVLSEVDIPAVIDPERGPGPKQRGFTVSLVADRRHYLLDVGGGEELYDLQDDPQERHDLRKLPGEGAALSRFRLALLQVLRADPATNTAAASYLLRFRRMLEDMTGRLSTRSPVP